MEKSRRVALMMDHQWPSSNQPEVRDCHPKQLLSASGKLLATVILS